MTTIPPHSQSEPAAALQVSDLSVEYLPDSGPIRVLDGVSFSIAAGEAFALVGESGSGKTSLCQALLRLLPPPAVITGGAVAIAGQEVLTADEKTLRQIRGARAAFVPQSAMNALSPLHSLGTHIEDVLAAHASAEPEGRRSARVRELLDLVGLEGVRPQDYPHELSAGMRQRVVIAMALAHRPALVMLDEPTAALDTIASRSLVRRLSELRARHGFALLLVTHDLPLALELAARVGVLHRGRLVEVASAHQLRTSPRHPHAVELLRACRQLTAAGRTASATSNTPTNPASESPLLSVRKLAHVFPGGWGRRRHVALEDVSFDLHAGEVVALVGGSGAGKTSIGRILVRRLSPTAGEIWWRGQDVLRTERRRASPEYRTAVQMVFQDPYASLNPARTVAHHLVRPLRRHRHARTAAEVSTQVMELLELVGLRPGADFARRHPHQLSGGQRQRLCVARALAVKPDLLIADEPTSMLDLSVRAELLDLLRSLRDSRRLGFLYITHDLASARAFADRVLVLHEGKIVDAGPTARVLATPAHPHTAELLAASPKLEI